jgi:hypothetical protein
MRIDSGILTITNKRLIFDGTKETRVISLEKLLSTEVAIDSVEISVENRQKGMALLAENPIILSSVIRLCCQT